MFLSLVVGTNEAHAVGSKVASKVAVKVAKELIVDTAVSEAMDIIFHKQMDDFLSGKYEVDEGYVAVCLDETPTDQCDKPAQIKETITEVDKKAISEKAEINLDTKMGNTSWIKFLDWFVPLIGMGVALTWLETQLAPDTESLFEQVATESLEDTGVVKPVNPKEKTQTVDNETGNVVTVPEGTPTETNEPTVTIGGTEKPYADIPAIYFSREVIFNSTNSDLSTYNGSYPEMLESMQYVVMQRDVTSTDPSYDTSSIDMKLGSTRMKLFGSSLYFEFSASSGMTGSKNGPAVMLYKNGALITQTYSSSGPAVNSASLQGTIDLDNVSKVVAYPVQYTSTPTRTYSWNDPSMLYFQRIIEFTVGADVYKVIASIYGVEPSTVSSFYVKEAHPTNLSTQLSIKTHIFNNVSEVNIPTYQPVIEDFPLGSVDLSKYKENEVVKILPPEVVPISTPEGVPVKPLDTSSTGWVKTDTGEEIVVDEETLIVSDPVEVPEGFQTPDGQTLPPPQTTPPPGEESTPPASDDITEGDFEELSCARPEKPDFQPISNSFTTSFPFSIPWDVKRFIDNAFGGVGDERPVFALGFLGEGVVVEIPEYFDSWVSFAKGLTVLVFDVSILYLFYRFMKGGGD